MTSPGHSYRAYRASRPSRVIADIEPPYERNQKDRYHEDAHDLGGIDVVETHHDPCPRLGSGFRADDNHSPGPGLQASVIIVAYTAARARSSSVIRRRRGTVVAFTRECNRPRNALPRSLRDTWRCPPKICHRSADLGGAKLNHATLGTVDDVPGTEYARSRCGNHAGRKRCGTQPGRNVFRTHPGRNTSRNETGRNLCTGQRSRAEYKRAFSEAAAQGRTSLVVLEA